MNYITAYLTKNTADEEGNFYVPILVPDTAELNQPITKVSIPDELSGKGVRFDWLTQTWLVSTEDPTVAKVNNFETTLSSLEQQNANMVYQLMIGGGANE